MHYEDVGKGMKYDPEYKTRNWWEFLSNPEDYANYNWFKRPQAMKRIADIENTGKIDKPTITIHERRGA